MDGKVEDVIQVASDDAANVQSGYDPFDDEEDCDACAI